MRPPLSSAQAHGQWVSAELCGVLARGFGRREIARFLWGWPSVTQAAAQASARTSPRHARPRHKWSDTLQTRGGQTSAIHHTGGGGGQAYPVGATMWRRGGDQAPPPYHHLSPLLRIPPQSRPKREARFGFVEQRDVKRTPPLRRTGRGRGRLRRPLRSERVGPVAGGRGGALASDREFRFSIF